MGKILQAAGNGTLIYRLRRKARRAIPLYFVGNRKLAEKCAQANTYRKLLRKYRKVLDAGSEQSSCGGGRCRKIWICWFQGYENAPPLVRACINSVRRAFRGWEITVLSQKNISDYVRLPDYIVKKHERGIIPPAQYSDLLRAELLCRYGGLWCDTTLLCTASDRPPACLTEGDFFVFKSLDLSRDDETPTVASSWLIYSARPGNRILLKTRALLYAYWRRENVLKDYFLFHIFFAMAARKYGGDWQDVPVFNNHSPHVLQFELERAYTKARWEQILAMSDFHKLNHHTDYSGLSGSFYNHVLEEFGE